MWSFSDLSCCRVASATAAASPVANATAATSNVPDAAAAPSTTHQ